MQLQSELATPQGALCSWQRAKRVKTDSQKTGKMTPTIIHCSKGLRDKWRGRLPEEWKRSYPQLFDDDDMRLSQQGGYHFFEWLAAIYLFHRDGALSLIEKYTYRNHKQKRAVLDSILRPQERDYLIRFRRNRGFQPPDLFVYSPHRQTWSFAEVKSPNDRDDARQRHQFEEFAQLAKRLNTSVELVSVAWWPAKQQTY
jgi:hypothetical protein